jgi:hypothetical protein
VFTLIFSNKIITFKRIIKGVMVLTVALLILLFLTAPVYVNASVPEVNVNLLINVSWGGGDMLNLDITDLETGEHQQVAIRLSDFLREDENVPYILLQARDLPGERQSGVIQIENPLFDPTKVATGATAGNSGSSVGVEDLPDNLQNIVAEANRPAPPTLTPDGTGTVVDNIMTINDIEFFTVTTDNGSDFFLVVDRQRTSNNVYLLNTVTEADLMALAEARGETLPSNSANTPTGQPPANTEQPPILTMEEILQAIQAAAEQNQPEPTPPPTPQNNNSGIILLGVLLLFLGGGGFAVWKLLLPKLKEMGQGDQEETEEDIEDEDFEDEEFHSGSGDVVLKDGDSFGFDGDGDSEYSDGGSEYDGGDTDDEE